MEQIFNGLLNCVFHQQIMINKKLNEMGRQQDGRIIDKRLGCLQAERINYDGNLRFFFFRLFDNRHNVSLNSKIFHAPTRKCVGDDVAYHLITKNMKLEGKTHNTYSNVTSFISYTHTLTKEKNFRLGSFHSYHSCPHHPQPHHSFHELHRRIN